MRSTRAAGRTRREIDHCGDCGASYRNGRWTWSRRGRWFWSRSASDPEPRLCPACDRMRRRDPAGVLHVAGGFVAAHRDAVLRLVRRVEERESAAHPLSRVIAIAEERGGFAVGTTAAKLADALGRALQKKYEGRLELPAKDAAHRGRYEIRWRRDE
jgi:NMD protein affecting ribosome stability and mRNA decay